jgi:hypothetical protein
MILLGAWVAIALWYRDMAKRRAGKKPVADWERPLAVRLNRIVRRVLAAVLVVWLCVLVVHCSQGAAVEAAGSAVDQCTVRLSGDALQACMEAPQRVFMESMTTRATTSALLWIVGVL